MTTATTKGTTAIPGGFDQLRVDQVGSLLRPAVLKDAFSRRARGEIDDSQLERIQDEAIADVVAKQEQHGLPFVNDGEFRRLNFMESFADVAGFEGWKQGWANLISSLEEQRDAEQTKHTERGLDPVLVVREPASERLRLVRNRPLDEYRFVTRSAARPASVTLIGPDRIVQGFDSEGSQPVYADVDEFVHDVIAVERQIVTELLDAGCRYLHIDEPGYTAYVDEPSLESMRARGEDPMANLDRAIRAGNAVIADFPEATFGLHMCRGNRQSHWHREGRYDAIAERVFTGLDHRRLLLEYDTERAGTFAPLRFVPKGKVVVLGLITTKTPEVETADDLKRRIEEASRHIPIEQLALSPQCGFASVIGGNLLTEDDQWRKLEVMIQTSEQVWGQRASA